MLADGRIVLCASNDYSMKYYFNKKFDPLPESIKEELHMISVLYAKDVGGIFEIVFEEDGEVSLIARSAEEDVRYDEVSACLLIGEIRRNRAELLDSLQIYYRAFILGEDVADLLDEESQG
ncbi:MAG: DUF6145 family protein [Lachnospiraceae bacterium]|nr:DUF6145 family protein [Lachnospiraceae bacterium]